MIESIRMKPSLSLYQTQPAEAPLRDVVLMCSGCVARRLLRCVCVCVLLTVCCRAFELQDTIHALIEENIHLHDQLENLTRALRELRQLLFQHSDGARPLLTFCLSSSSLISRIKAFCDVFCSRSQSWTRRGTPASLGGMVTAQWVWPHSVTLDRETSHTGSNSQQDYDWFCGPGSHLCYKYYLKNIEIIQKVHALYILVLYIDSLCNDGNGTLLINNDTCISCDHIRAGIIDWGLHTLMLKRCTF